VTFIITAVAEGCTGDIPVAKSPFILEKIVTHEQAPSRAGYLPGLARHLHGKVEGAAFHVVLADEDGWKSSNALFEYPDDNDSPAYLWVPDHLRAPFATVLNELQRCATDGRVILMLEFNGAVTSPDSDDDTNEMVDIVGPLSPPEFWRRHDLHELVEESIVILDPGDHIPSVR
jgi:hypothetical protein